MIKSNIAAIAITVFILFGELSAGYGFFKYAIDHKWLEAILFAGVFLSQNHIVIITWMDIGKKIGRKELTTEFEFENQENKNNG